ncbi:hypothetical protein CC80DRAFT_541648 [Byssothecium circinans]|uniref:Uncharacterized protein n=1 Tax=Byssothecium circinans TaxID=147558 RepID=A0A6A5UEU6_9PLEO|nr:hypothetical protein CC80DRAFT_541648 [Byssothecium circinans]
MAPQAHTSTSSPSLRLPREAQPQQPASQSTNLPGMKRGIAIGVAASITIILIAVLAHFVYRRRKNLKTKTLQAQLDQSNNTPNTPSWPKEKYDTGAGGDYWRTLPAPPAPPVEADAMTIHEMDGTGRVPELPTKLHVQELPGDVGGEEHRQRKTATGTGLSDWAKWTAALNTPSLTTPQPQPQPALPNPQSQTTSTSTSRPSSSRSASNRPELPQLNICPAEVAVSPVRSAASEGCVSPFGAATVGTSTGTRSSVGISPLSVSPLDEVYLPATPRSARHWV